MSVNPADREAAVSLPGIEGSSDNVEMLYGQDCGLVRDGGGWKVTLPGISAGVYRV